MAVDPGRNKEVPRESDRKVEADDKHHETGASAETAWVELEPELRGLRGIMMVLQHLSERHDPVEPLALAVLARAGSEALTRLARLDPGTWHQDHKRERD
jgi:hypothetical protein